MRVAVTFDDGYEDNFRVALPILQRFSVPACVFLVTNQVGTSDALWWDRVGSALFAYWRQGAQQPIPPELPRRAEALRRERSSVRARAIISAILGDLNMESTESRARAVRSAENLVAGPGVSRTMLSWEEVREMSNAGIMFGAHTQNHVPLDELSHERAREELFGSQRQLEQQLTRPHARLAALPRGRLGPMTVAEFRQEGFLGVMTTEPGVNRSGEDALFVHRRDGRMLTLHGRHHPAKLRLELTGLVDRLRYAVRGDPRDLAYAYPEG